MITVLPARQLAFSMVDLYSIVDFFPRVCFFCPDSEAIGVIPSSIGRVACLHFGAGLLVQLQSAVAGAVAVASFAKSALVGWYAFKPRLGLG